MENGVRPGVYRHFKGGLYEMVGVATAEANGAKVIIYRALKDGTWWTRDFVNFFETVQVGQEQVPRFELQQHRFPSMAGVQVPDGSLMTTPNGDRFEHRSGCWAELRGCTGMTARWCPIHGDCCCGQAAGLEEMAPLDALGDVRCPLHAPGSPHGEPGPDE